MRRKSLQTSSQVQAVEPCLQHPEEIESIQLTLVTTKKQFYLPVVRGYQLLQQH